MKIDFAIQNDLAKLSFLDKHISEKELANLISLNRVLVARADDKICGWLRCNLFWDNIPFMNMLYVLDEYRNKQLGAKLVEFWEKEMRTQGYTKLMTSTLSNEDAQHFYRKLGYKDCGGLLLPNEPLEILFIKIL